MAKRILVTGSAGFVGSHVCLALKRRGDWVVGLDNFNPYYQVSLKRAREQLLNNKGVNIFEGDICDAALLQRLAQEHQITHLVHLAAQAGVRYSLENPHAYLDTNIKGFLNILELCRSFPEIKLTYASSSSVYGSNGQIPFSLEDSTDHQASLYGVTKKSNELMARTYHELFGLHVTGLRFFTVYGPWGRPDMAYFKFAEAMRKNEPIAVYNGGDLRRDFTYIDDIVQGTLSAIDKESPCALYNLGNCHPEPLEALINALEEALQIKAERHLLPMQAGDVLETYADISVSTKELGFYPRVSLKEGIQRFIAWYQKWVVLNCHN